MASVVPDEEILYRRLVTGGWVVEAGVVRISSQAFSDRNLQPSVDLASLCAPTDTQEGADNGVLSLVTSEVRAIRIRGAPPKPEPTLDQPHPPKPADVEHSVDVHPCPVKDAEGQRDNPAHAEIRPAPKWCNKNVFRKLQERLALMATMLVKPAPLR